MARPAVPVTSLVFAVACALLAVTPSSAQLAIVVGAEFQVNSYTTGFQSRAALASETNGDFVVVWDSEQQDGSGKGVFGRRFTSAGAALGAEFLVNLHVDGEQWAPSVAMDGDGDFVVVWHDGSHQDGSAYGIFARRYASSGAAIGGEFWVNSYTFGFQSYPSVAMDSSGRFVVVWQSYYVDGSLFSIQTRRFDSSGAPQGTEVEANFKQLGNQILPAAAIDDAGAFVVAWESYGQDGDAYGIFALEILGDVTPTGELMVNAFTDNDQRSASVGMTANGGFVVVWSSAGGADGDQDGVFARRFSSTGLTYGAGQVNKFTAMEQSEPAVAVSADGSYVVAWTDESLDGDSPGIFARRVTANGATFGPDLQINSFTDNNQTRPSIARAGGRLVVAWENSPSGLHTEIIARRVAVSAVLDVDGDGTLAPLTDGLLLLRYLFGFGGSTLTSGALGAACTRCTASAIASYIGTIMVVLDIDDDGPVQPLTDGLLVVRYLFGFRGTALTVGAVSPNCDHCTAAEIESYFLPYV